MLTPTQSRGTSGASERTAHSRRQSQVGTSPVCAIYHYDPFILRSGLHMNPR